MSNKCLIIYSILFEDSDDDDNITVTVPPAHLQSRGAQFRDRRVRKPLPPNMETHEVYPSVVSLFNPN